MRRVLDSWVADLGVFVVALAVLAAAVVVLGFAFDGDGFSYLIWGRELASGAHLHRNNPSFTVPKWLPIGLAAAAHLVPGARAPELVYLLLTAAAGAGALALTARLARRLGGALAGLLVVPLVLGHMQFLRYVLNGQSTIFVSLLIVGALLLATREAARPRDYAWAAVLLFVAGLARPEAAALGGALGLALWLRVGWRRPLWPAVVAAIGTASLGVGMLLDRLAFGSFGYARAIVRDYTALQSPKFPSLFAGFAAKAARTVFYFGNQSWPLVLLAVAGLVLAGRRLGLARAAALVLFPLATVAFTWLLVLMGILYNARCYFYVMFLLVALAAAAMARAAEWAGSREKLLAFAPRWARQAAAVAVLLAAVAVNFATRPIPTDQARHNRRVDKACDFLAARLPKGPAPPRILASDEMGQVFYRLQLPPDDSCLLLVRVVEQQGGKLPDDVEWYVRDSTISHSELPAGWGFTQVWQDDAGRVQVYARGAARSQEGGT